VFDVSQNLDASLDDDDGIIFRPLPRAWCSSTEIS
jgi:hypothetical protein